MHIFTKLKKVNDNINKKNIQMGLINKDTEIYGAGHFATSLALVLVFKTNCGI